MLGPLKFRHRIGLLVLLAAMGLVTVTAVTLLLGRRSEQQLSGIETRYVPLLELDRDLKTMFAEITRALEDAANSADESRLADADTLNADLARHLTAGEQTIEHNGGDARALRSELAAYYVLAREVSVALIGGESQAKLNPKSEQMRRAQLAFAAHLDAATRPDRRRLAEAFETARDTQNEALWIDIVVAGGVLLLMALLSWRIIRRTVRSLHAVSEGVERLASGELGEEIGITTPDEIGELAREANRTAARLRDYRERAGTLLSETTRQAEELRSAYEQLETRNAELASASKHKSEFLANMSHELRTPLNSIMILSKVLGDNAEGILTAKQVEFATLINKSGEELLALINEVLDLAKVEAGKQTVICKPMVVGEVVAYVRGMFEPLAAQKGLAFVLSTVGDLPEQIRTDRSRLEQILKNLLSNAFKFTKAGSVTARFARTPASELPAFVDRAIVDPIVISVVDTGIGIAADQQAWIFEAFAQAETGTSRTFGGTGLGLTIARQLAVRLGGDLYVESTLGHGSTFWLVLPIAGPAADAADVRSSRPSARTTPPVSETPRIAIPEPGTTAEPLLDGKTVMIVDDDMRNVYSLSSSLRAKRLEVITAADGAEALEELDKYPEIQLVLAGQAAMRRIRAEPRFAPLTIIALAASNERESCLAAGANDCLEKPIELDRLLGVLRTWLGPRA